MNKSLFIYLFYFLRLYVYEHWILCVVIHKIHHCMLFRYGNEICIQKI